MVQAGFDLAAFVAVHPAETRQALRRPVKASAEGELRIQVEVLELERVVEAHRRIEAGATTGELVLDLTAP
ncbi:zinc-binding dehydrogenase [Streptomyces sp. NPDC050564]|uniref:zinc-binding dehydrogenase n=1 Tax=Streptomyces sp. NPDC050564 TaxID=3365631 RepID=UPI0037A9F896